MSETIGVNEIRAMLAAAAETIQENCDHLGRLDAATGDGDHGIAMVNAMKEAEKALADNPDADLQPLLKAVGWGIMGMSGGSTGPLFGSLFMGMSKAVAGRPSLDTAGSAEIFEGGTTRIRKRTDAEIGDKTLMDAYLPATAAIRAAAEEGKSVVDALAAAAAAAKDGADATHTMQARFGRARNLGERSKGSPDPGATSVSLIMAAFSAAVSE